MTQAFCLQMSLFGKSKEYFTRQGDIKITIKEYQINYFHTFPERLFSGLRGKEPSNFFDNIDAMS